MQPHAKSRHARSTALPFAAAVLSLLLAGCTALSTPRSHVVRSAPPTLSRAAALPVLPADDSKLPLILSESGRVMDANVLTFFAAREAFWDYHTDEAVRLLRELRAADAIGADHFHELVLQCYEQSGRWAEAIPLYREFGIEESHSARLAFARFMSGLPPRRIEFAPDAPAVPITVQHGTWVVVEGRVNGVKARLGLDTGAGLSWVSQAFAQRAGLEIFPQTISLADANGRERQTPIALVRELRFGGLTVRDMPVVAGRALLMAVFGGADMIVGWEVLQHADLTLDFPARQLTFQEPRGPVSAEPNLSGRIGPILTVLSSAGRPMDLFVDTGAGANRRTAMTVFANDGVLATKVPLEDFRASWLPTIGAGLHSFTASWPRRARPFAFWMGGHRFELPSAALDQRVQLQEQLVHIDGVVGNAPFLGGKLRICGVRRELSFQPAARSFDVEPARPNDAANAGADRDPSRRRRPVLPLIDFPVVDLANVMGDHAFLSEVRWAEASVGWGRPVRNQFWVDDTHAVPLEIQGERFDRGLYAHSASRYVFVLDAKWKVFSATVGLRDGAHQQGSAIFTVRGDGRELYRSRLLRAGERDNVRVDLAGVNQLELSAEGGEGHPHNSWAIWAEPLVRR